MSTQAALEEQVWSALLDVNDHRLEAHTAAEASKLADTHKAFDDIITAARAGIAAVEAIETIIHKRPAATCDAPVNECAFFTAPDDQCRFSALPHEEFCSRHQFHGETVWSESHEVDQCCPFHCDGAEHTADAIVVRRAA